MGKVRPFVEEDVPWVKDLFVKVFLGGDASSTSDLDSYFRQVFFANPCYEQGLPSLVYEEAGGKGIGFLGVMPRRMRLNGRPILVANSFHFMVEPGNRSSLAAVEMLKTLFRGPQDLTMTDGAGTLGRQIWEGLGGSTSLLYSLRWTRWLRPSRCVLDVLATKGLPRFLQYAAVPFATMVDAVATRVLRSQFRVVPQGPEEELDVGTLLACLNEFKTSKLLYPEYDQHSLNWVLGMAEQRKEFGKLKKIVVRNVKNEILGWYLYFVKPGDTSEVLQISARKGSVQKVLDHLFYHAWRQGMIAVSGRVDPQFMQEYSDKYCTFRRRGPWILVQSKSPEVLQAIFRGDAFLTRLEGEWCLHR